MKILSLNGGGVLGYIPLSILERVEDELGKPSCEIFDLIGGVSTGSIIGASLANGHYARTVKGRYKDLSKEIFKKKRSFFGSLWKPLYDINNLEDQVKIFFEDLSLKELKTKFMAYALRIDGEFLDSQFWKSWRDETEIYKVLCASSAAPHFFQPYGVDGKWFIDGALVGNNPSMSLITEAMKDGTPLEEMQLLNLWSDNINGIHHPSKFYGLLTLLPRLSELFTTGGEDSIDYYSERLLGDNFVSIRPESGLSIDTDDFEKMETVARRVWGENREQILDLLS